LGKRHILLQHRKNVFNLDIARPDSNSHSPWPKPTCKQISASRAQLGLANWSCRSHRAPAAIEMGLCPRRNCGPFTQRYVPRMDLALRKPQQLQGFLKGPCKGSARLTCATMPCRKMLGRGWFGR
jgi:hypothetical protein